MHKSMRLKYEPASEPLHISVSGWYRGRQLSQGSRQLKASGAGRRGEREGERESERARERER